MCCCIASIIRRAANLHVFIDKLSLLACGFSAGVGRTGTFIGLDLLVDEAHDQRNSVNVMRCVHNMRLQRTQMVQTSVCYHNSYSMLMYVNVHTCMYHVVRLL